MKKCSFCGASNIRLNKIKDFDACLECYVIAIDVLSTSSMYPVIKRMLISDFCDHDKTAEFSAMARAIEKHVSSEVPSKFSDVIKFISIELSRNGLACGRVNSIKQFIAAKDAGLIREMPNAIGHKKWIKA